MQNQSSYRPILQVEDDPNDVMLFEMALGRAKIPGPFVVVTDGEQAVNYLNGTGVYADRTTYPLPGLMLLDIKLPRKSGLEVLSWARSQPALRRLPIVMVTASDQQKDIDAAYELGANSYLVKPNNLDLLADMVKLLHNYWRVVNVWGIEDRGYSPRYVGAPPSKSAGGAGSA